MSCEVEIGARQQQPEDPIESWITVHVRGPQTDWVKIKVDQFGTFDLTVSNVKTGLNAIPKSKTIFDKF
jgi:hypothetical protein